jgi:DNA-directed RNA polymerase specialized sigma subunit
VSDSSETNGGETLADASRDEREVAADRLRGELGRDPSDEEIDEWLRQHTEGY